MKLDLACFGDLDEVLPAFHRAGAVSVHRLPATALAATAPDRVEALLDGADIVLLGDQALAATKPAAAAARLRGQPVRPILCPSAATAGTTVLAWQLAGFAEVVPAYKAQAALSGRALPQLRRWKDDDRPMPPWLDPRTWLGRDLLEFDRFADLVLNVSLLPWLLIARLASGDFDGRIPRLALIAEAVRCSRRCLRHAAVGAGTTARDVVWQHRLNGVAWGRARNLSIEACARMACCAESPLFRAFRRAGSVMPGRGEPWTARPCLLHAS